MFRFQAIECYLARVKPKEAEWAYEAVDKFDELTHLAQWKKLKARVNGYRERDTSPYGRAKREGSPIPGVDLYDVNNENDIDIGAEMVNIGYAVYDETVNGSPTDLERKISDCEISLTNGDNGANLGSNSLPGTSNDLRTTLDSKIKAQTDK